MAFYQCFKTVDRVVYCSKTQYKNHAEGERWVSECMRANNIQGRQISGKPFTSERQPSGATIWP